MAASTYTTASASIIFPSLTTSTNLGALPSTSFPAACLASLYDMNRKGFGVPWTYETQGCAVSTCCPSGNYYSQAFAWMTSYYSPGVCPEQYRSCAPPPGTGPQSLVSSDGESIAFCCPTDYDCPYASKAGIFLFCQSLLSTSTSVIVLNNIYDQQTVSTRKFTLAKGMANSYQLAYPIQVRLKPGETVPTASSVSSTPRETGLPSSSGPSDSTSGIAAGSSSSSPPAGSGGSKLSAGAIVGIAFGGFFALALLIGGILFFLYKTRKQRNSSEVHQQHVLPTQQNPSLAAGAHYWPQNQRTSELAQFWSQGAPGGGAIHELPDEGSGTVNKQTHELKGSENEMS